MYYLYHIVYIETIVFFIVVECSFFLESNWGPFCTEVENIDRSMQHFIFKDNQNLSVETFWSQGTLFTQSYTYTLTHRGCNRSGEIEKRNNNKIFGLL